MIALNRSRVLALNSPMHNSSKIIVAAVFVLYVGELLEIHAVDYQFRVVVIAELLVVQPHKIVIILNGGFIAKSTENTTSFLFHLKAPFLNLFIALKQCRCYIYMLDIAWRNFD